MISFVNSLVPHNNPTILHRDENSLSIQCGEVCDLFCSPQTETVLDTAPILLAPASAPYVASALVKPVLIAKYDAGFLASYSDSRNWAKLALECSPQGEHMIVSVVTVDGFSDDSCHVVLDPQSTVYLRIAVEEKHTAFHYSTNGQYWHLVRVFRSVRSKDAVRFGLGVQSPTGKGTKSAFEQLKFGAGQEVKDIRNGQ